MLHGFGKPTSIDRRRALRTCAAPDSGSACTAPPYPHVPDLASGRITDLFEGTGYEIPRVGPGTDGFAISPDGRHLVFAFDPELEKRIENRKVLIELNLRLGNRASLWP